MGLTCVLVSFFFRPMEEIGTTHFQHVGFHVSSRNGHRKGSSTGSSSDGMGTGGTSLCLRAKDWRVPVLGPADSSSACEARSASVFGS